MGDMFMNQYITNGKLLVYVHWDGYVCYVLFVCMCVGFYKYWMNICDFGDDSVFTIYVNTDIYGLSNFVVCAKFLL